MAKDIAAFPHTVEYMGADCGGVVPHGGMTLRDYFAGQVLTSMNLRIGVSDSFYAETAKHCYALADAMMKAREKNT